MRVAYVLLSSTFGMHQYTADLADSAVSAGHEVYLVTTEQYVADRYGPEIQVRTPVTSGGTGFNASGFRLPQYKATCQSIKQLQPDVVHFTGVHLWNPALLWQLRQARIPTIHTLHDLDPHPGVRYGALIQTWNRLVFRNVDHVLVHGECYHSRVIDESADLENVTAIPLIHLFGSHNMLQELVQSPPDPTYEQWALFFGRLEAYKGVKELLNAANQLEVYGSTKAIVIAGQGSLRRYWSGPIPKTVRVIDHHIDDEEAVEFFQRCGVVVLPYTGATQSALIAAAYAFSKPVIVSDSGALAEYVVPDETGWIVPAGDSTALANVLNEALSNHDRLAEMGQAGRRWYVDKTQMADEMLVDMYERVYACSTAQRTH